VFACAHGGPFITRHGAIIILSTVCAHGAPPGAPRAHSDPPTRAPNRDVSYTCVLLLHPRCGRSCVCTVRTLHARQWSSPTVAPHGSPPTSAGFMRCLPCVLAPLTIAHAVLHACLLLSSTITVPFPLCWLDGCQALGCSTITFADDGGDGTELDPRKGAPPRIAHYYPADQHFGASKLLSGPGGLQASNPAK
jgi:hypothetical protein